MILVPIMIYTSGVACHVSVHDEAYIISCFVILCLKLCGLASSWYIERDLSKKNESRQGILNFHRLTEKERKKNC